MAKVQWKGGALLAPLPAVLVTCKQGDKRNVLTAAWTGITNTQPPKTYISLRKSRYSYPMIRESGVFVLNLTTEEMVKTVDFCGVRSGKDIDKFEVCHLDAEPAQVVDAPLLTASPLSLECKVTDIIELGSHDLFLADIVATDVNEELIDNSGRMALEKAGLLAYVHGEYYSLGKRLGKFGFSVEKKKRHSTVKSHSQKPKQAKK